MSSSKRSYYRIDRTFLLDEMGTLFGESFLTSSKESLVGAFSTAIHSGEFPDDNLIRSWTASVQQNKNFLSDLWIPDLHIEDGTGKVRTMKLLPDVTVRRGPNEFQVTLIEDVNDMFTFEVRYSDPNGEVTTTPHSSIAKVGDDRGLLMSLGSGDQAIEVILDHSRLIERIPSLKGEVLTEVLPFRPFHDNETFRDFVRDQLPGKLVAMIPKGRDWAGDVPLETWFPASSLLEACDDAGCGNFDFW